jgi:tetratricopeptide (TPR) repeat protein
MSAKSLFPHQQLNWLSQNLEKDLAGSKNKAALSNQLAMVHISLAFFHEGGESACAKANAFARKALLEEGTSVVALAISGLALLGMERPQKAQKYITQAVALGPTEPLVLMAEGEMAKANGDMPALLQCFERACHLLPDAWELNFLFGRSLLASGMRQGESKSIHRALYHLIRAKDLGIIALQKPILFREIGIACLHTGRYSEAERYFLRIQENPNYLYTARYHLGFVAYHLGKFNNAINHFRFCIQQRQEDPKLLARIAACWYHLNDIERAKKACNQTMIRDPFNLMARQILGLCLEEEGNYIESARVFRETLKQHPDDMESYREIVRIRRMSGDIGWMAQALETEVSYYDRQPLGGDIDASLLTLKRIQVILEEFQEAGSVHLSTLLRAIDFTQDEHLRFRLWESAQVMLRDYMSYDFLLKLEEPGKNYGVDVGEAIASLWENFETTSLIAGLSVRDSDLEHAASERYEPAHDVEQHWQNLDKEKQGARVYQALVLLCLGLKKEEEGLVIIRKWASSSDVDMKLTAHLALIISGEFGSLKALKQHARTKEKQDAYQELKKATEEEGPKPQTLRFVYEGASCSSCNRKSEAVEQMMTNGVQSICSVCIQDLYNDRANHIAPDDAFCFFSGASHFDTSNLYEFRKIRISEDCVQDFLSEQERLLVDNYFFDG